jgi:hypothetical protein
MHSACRPDEMLAVHERTTMKKVSWIALIAGWFTDIGLQVIQFLLVILVFLRFQSVFLTYSWYLISEILASVLVGYVIGKIAKDAPLFNALVYYVGMFILTGVTVSLLPEEKWTHISSLWTMIIQSIELVGLCVGALMAKKRL